MIPKTRVQLRREELGLTQKELASALGYKSISNIENIEKGVSEIPQSRLNHFAKVLETSVAYLMGMLSKSDQKSQVKSVNLKNYGYVPEGVDYASRSDGSHAPLWEEGEIIFIKKDGIIENRKLSAVKLYGAHFIKKVYIEDDYLRFRSINKNIADVVLTKEEFEQVGEYLGRVVM